jgi:hypothetical protein
VVPHPAAALPTSTATSTWSRRQAADCHDEDNLIVVSSVPGSS